MSDKSPSKSNPVAKAVVQKRPQVIERKDRPKRMSRYDLFKEVEKEKQEIISFRESVKDW